MASVTALQDRAGPGRSPERHIDRSSSPLLLQSSSYGHCDQGALPCCACQPQRPRSGRRREQRPKQHSPTKSPRIVGASLGAIGDPGDFQMPATEARGLGRCDDPWQIADHGHIAPGLCDDAAQSAAQAGPTPRFPRHAHPIHHRAWSSRLRGNAVRARGHTQRTPTG